MACLMIDLKVGYALSLLLPPADAHLLKLTSGQEEVSCFLFTSFLSLEDSSNCILLSHHVLFLMSCSNELLDLIEFIGN